MTAFKKTLIEKGAKIMRDSRLLKIAQNRHLMKALRAIMNTASKFQNSIQAKTEQLIKIKALAVESDIEELKNKIRTLEEEVQDLQRTTKGQGREEGDQK